MSLRRIVTSRVTFAVLGGGAVLFTAFGMTGSAFAVSSPAALRSLSTRAADKLRTDSTSTQTHTPEAAQPARQAVPGPLVNGVPPNWKGRVVVSEYLTGTFCWLCMNVNRLIDTASKRYANTVFLPIAYHGLSNFPISNPVDSMWERMWDWYGLEGQRPGRWKDAGSEPWINGRGIGVEQNLFAGLEDSVRPTRLFKTIDAELEKAPEAFLRVTATGRDSKVFSHVTIDSVVGDHKSLFLRIVVVQDTARINKIVDSAGKDYPITSVGFPARVHPMVVRAVAHDGFFPLAVPLKMEEKGNVEHYTFDLAPVQKQLLVFYKQGRAFVQARGSKAGNATSKEEEDENPKISSSLPDEHDWTIDYKRLHVIAFVQDAYTGEILQAAIAKVTPQ